MTNALQKSLNLLAGTDGLAEQGAAAAAAGRINHALGEFRVGEYYIAGGNAAVTTGTISLNELRVVPQLVPTRTRLVELGCETTVVAAATGRVRLGIWDNVDCYPSSRLLTTARIDVETTLGYNFEAIDITLEPGLYWFGVCPQVATGPTFRMVNGFAPTVPLSSGTSLPSSSSSQGYKETGVTNTLPATFTATAATFSAAPRIIFKTGALA